MNRFGFVRITSASTKTTVANPEANADGTHGVPMPTVVIVDGTGIIRWIDVHPDYTTRTEVADIIDALSALG